MDSEASAEDEWAQCRYPKKSGADGSRTEEQGKLMRQIIACVARIPCDSPQALNKTVCTASITVEHGELGSKNDSPQRDGERCKKVNGFCKAGAACLGELNSFTRAVNQAVQSFQVWANTRSSQVQPTHKLEVRRALSPRPAEPARSGVNVEQLLSSLRKRFDDVHVQVQKRVEEVAKYKEGIRQADSAEQQIITERARLRQRTEHMEQVLAELQGKVKEAAHRKTVYLHILQRTKVEKEVVRQKNLRLQDNLKALGIQIKDTRRALEKQRRATYKTNCEVRQLEQELEGERLVRRQGAKDMDEAIGLKKAAAEKRQRLVHWQQCVVDDAAAAALSASSGRWRRMLCVEKLIANLLQKTSVENVERWQYKEDTFQKIREATGLINVMEIVSKFLNRDQENQKLKYLAAEAERRLEMSRTEYQEVVRRAVEDLTLGNCSHVRRLYGADSWNKILHGHVAKHYFLNDSLGHAELAKQYAIKINAKLAKLGMEVNEAPVAALLHQCKLGFLPPKLENERDLLLSVAVKASWDFAAGASVDAYYHQLSESSIPCLLALPQQNMENKSCLVDYEPTRTEFE
ncbi:hypothetical protein Efla_001349 [Eimeria flavescens]